MNRQEAREALQRFVNDRDLSVLALAGNWGVGKTYLWREFTRGQSLTKFNGISYVSLFGLASLDDFRLKAIGNMVLCRDRKEILSRYKDQAKASLIPYDLVSSGISKITQMLGAGWAGIATDVAYWFLRDSLVCLDDIERADERLTPTMIMGLIDELKGKDCKVVLILNREKAKAKHEDDLARYWEKVVDVDLKLTPKVSENVALAFGTSPKGAEYGEFAITVFEAVGADNIRVHKRAAWLVRQLDDQLAPLAPELRRYITQHAALLTWALIDPSAAIPADVILSSQYGFMYLTLTKHDGTERKLTEVEGRWATATDRLGFSPAEFDRHLIDLLTTGWCDPALLATTLRAAATEHRKDSARRRLRQMYLRYQESFTMDRTMYVEELRCVLAEELPHLSVFEFDSGLDSLARNGGDSSDLVIRYIAERGAHLQAVAEASERHRVPKDTRLAEEIGRRVREFQRTYHSIDSVAHHLMTSDGWGPSHTSFLAGQTPADFRDWILSEPPNLREKIIAVLAFGKKDDRRHKDAARPLVQALQALAAESEFNRERIEGVYEVAFDSVAADEKP